MKKYKLVEWGKIKGNSVFISKEQIIKLYEEVKKDKDISGFNYPIEVSK
jgi:hypothetical protein